jgi:hypothetical protein
VGGDVVEASPVGCYSRADGRASDPVPPDVLLDHHERAKTYATGGHWRRRCGEETAVIEDGDNRGIAVDLDLSSPVFFWQSILFSFFLCVS